MQERVVREIRTLRVMRRGLETELWTHLPATAPVPDPTKAKSLHSDLSQESIIDVQLRNSGSVPVDGAVSLVMHDVVIGFPAVPEKRWRQASKGVAEKLRKDFSHLARSVNAR